MIPKDRAVPPLPRFLPLQRLSATRSHITPAAPIPPVELRPQGFSPSRRLAPLMASRACSIPVPLMGFHPSRPSSSRGAVRPLERRAPPGFSSTTQRRGRPSRDSHTTQSPDTGLGTSQVAAPFASLGFPAPRFLARDSEGRANVLSSPHTLYRLGRTLTSPLAPQGIICRERSRSPSRSANPLAVLHLVILLDALGISQGWVMGSLRG